MAETPSSHHQPASQVKSERTAPAIARVVSTGLDHSVPIVGVLAAAIAGVAFFLHCFGAEILNPAKIDWLLFGGDPATYYLGWLFYRQEPWTLPPGAIHGYLAPMGTSICLTDSLPILAMPLKLVARLLPATFQYLGFWMMLSCALQAVFGYLIVRLFRGGRPVTVAGTLLFLGSPIMMYRQGGHIALTAHWCVLCGLWLYLRPEAASVGVVRRALPWCALVLVTALIHPYLALMTLALAGAYLVRNWLLDRSMGLLPAVLSAAAMVAVLLGIWALSGYFIYGSEGQDVGPDFRAYSLNLNAFWNPLGNGRFLASPPLAKPTQYEGYAYLGLGALVGLFYAVSALVARRPGRRTWMQMSPLLAVVLVLAWFALSSQVTLGASTLVKYKLFWPFSAASKVIRASGRFAWPLYYVVLAGIIWTFVRRTDRRVLPWLLGGCVALQAADMLPTYSRRHDISARGYASLLQSPEWERAGPHFDHLVTYPPYQTSTQYSGDFRSLALWAAEHRKTTSAGYAARYWPLAVQQYTAELDTVFQTGSPDLRSLYVLTPTAYAGFAPQMADSFRCALLDGYVVCCATASPWRAPGSLVARKLEFSEFLRETSDRLVVLAVKDEATWHLAEEAKRLLRAFGSKIDELGDRGSYVAILDHGRVVEEWVDNRHAIEVRKDAGSDIGSVRLPQPLALKSAGYKVGNTASIRLGEQEYSLMGRGMNAVVLDSAGSVESLGTFDTFLGTPGALLTPNPM